MKIMESIWKPGFCLQNPRLFAQKPMSFYGFLLGWGMRRVYFPRSLQGSLLEIAGSHQRVGLVTKKIPQLAGKILSIDGRNPKQPPGMYKTLKILGQTTYHLVHLRETRYIFKGGFQLNFFLDFLYPENWGRIRAYFFGWVRFNHQPGRPY